MEQLRLDNPVSMQLADTEALYLPLHTDAPHEGRLLRDLSYGPDPRHRLDVLPHSAQDGALRPVFVFVPGGGFTTGERRRPGTPFHDNVLLWAGRAGMVGVNLGYRLAPDHPWPSAGKDVLQAMEHIAREAPRWGGDPERICLLGHSAGAAHVAEALVRAPSPDGRPPWAATMLLSGIYAPEQVASTPGREAYYGTDRCLWQARGAAMRIGPLRAPLCVLSSEREPEEFARQAALLCEQVRRHGGDAHPQVLAGHNHFSPVLSLGSPDACFAHAIEAFLQAWR